MAKKKKALSEEQERARELDEMKPYARFRKTIVGKVGVLFLHPITFSEYEGLLVGDPSDPKTRLEDITVDVWTRAEYDYFVKKNRGLLENGSLIEFEGEDLPPMDTTNQISDEEIDELLSKADMALRNRLDKFTSEVPVQRILLKALALDKPTSMLNLIKAKLADLQGFQMPPHLVEKEVSDGSQVIIHQKT